MEVQNIIIPLTANEVYCNGRRKINPMTGEVLEDVISNRAIFRKLEVVAWGEDKRKVRLAGEGDSDAKERSAKRARKRLFELAACNPFELFVTLTLDQKEIDRYDYKIVIKKMNQWLTNLVKRKGFAYIFVPERHKDGAIHFHGLCTSAGLTLLPSGHRDKSKRDILNVANWRYGYTTAVKLDGDYTNVCKYITKYIRKDMGTDGTIGGRYYLHGGKLNEPWCQWYEANYEDAEGKEVCIEEAGGLRLKYINTQSTMGET